MTPGNSSISSFNPAAAPPQPGLQTFLFKFALLGLPVFAVFGFSFFLLLASGELTPANSFFIQPRSRHPTLVGLAYSNPVVYFKLQSILSENPEVMALGSSRILTLREEFFREGVFYNAGSSVGLLRDFRTVLQRIPAGKEPKVILLGLDQNFFNEVYDERPRPDMQSRYGRTQSPTEIYKDSWSIAVRDFFNKKFTLSQLFFNHSPIRRIGLNAFANDEGFRQDGSYQFGRFLKNPQNPKYRDIGFKIALGRVAQGGSHLEFGDKVSTGLLREFTRFLEDCRSRHIYLICFLPPYAHSLYEALLHTGKHEYIFQLESILKPLLSRYGFDFYNFSDLASLGVSDDQAIDGLHMSERAYLHLLIEILKKNEPLRQYAYPDRLKKLLKDSNSLYAVIDS